MMKYTYIGSFIRIARHMVMKNNGKLTMVSQLARGMFYMSSRKGRHFFMVGKVVSCFGHRDIILNENLEQRILFEIQKAINEGAKTFLFGGLSDLDNYCYKVVTKIKNEQPQLNLQRIFCFPLETHLRKPPVWFVDWGYEDKIFLQPSFNGWYKSIYYRNCTMIDNSDFIIFYAKNLTNSGAYKAYKYAIKNKKPCVNLAN